jgi:hypothetical protein
VVRIGRKERREAERMKSRDGGSIGLSGECLYDLCPPPDSLFRTEGFGWTPVAIRILRRTFDVLGEEGRQVVAADDGRSGRERCSAETVRSARES